MTDALQCLKCGGPMEEGFTADATYGQLLASTWIRGVPQSAGLASGVKGPPRKFLGGLKDESDARTIQSFRCSECGFVEHYANKPSRW